jgi:hypothetical protein
MQTLTPKLAFVVAALECVKARLEIKRVKISLGIFIFAIWRYENSKFQSKVALFPN